jgi:hypothetical protein
VAERTGAATAEPTGTAAAERSQPATARVAPRSLEDIRREARENWLKMREEQKSQGDAAAPTRNPATRTQTPAPDDDHQP